MGKGEEGPPDAGEIPPNSDGLSDEDIENLFDDNSTPHHPDADYFDMMRDNNGPLTTPNKENGNMGTTEKKNNERRKGIGEELDIASERLRIGRELQKTLVSDPTCAALMLGGEEMCFNVERFGPATDTALPEVLEFYSSIRPHVSFKITETHETHFVVVMTVEVMSKEVAPESGDEAAPPNSTFVPITVVPIGTDATKEGGDPNAVASAG